MATSTDVDILIASITVVGSWAGAAYIAGLFRGSTETRLTMLEANQDKLATKEQLAGIKEDVAEIKGMFRMTLRKDEGAH